MCAITVRSLIKKHLQSAVLWNACNTYTYLVTYQFSFFMPYISITYTNKSLAENREFNKMGREFNKMVGIGIIIIEGEV